MSTEIKHELDVNTMYSETCGFIKHYSSASMMVRIITVAQGIALLAAWGWNYVNSSQNVQISIAFIGVLFTFLLYGYHKAYYDAAVFYYSIASDIESRYSSINSPTKKYMEYRNNIYKDLSSKFTKINSVFTLVGCCFFAALLLSINK